MNISDLLTSANPTVSQLALKAQQYKLEHGQHLISDEEYAVLTSQLLSLRGLEVDAATEDAKIEVEAAIKLLAMFLRI